MDQQPPLTPEVLDPMDTMELPVPPAFDQLTGEMPMEPGFADDPIAPELSEEALDKLKIDLERDLTSAEGAKVNIDRNIERYRGYMSLDRPPPAYEGAPNHVVPYARAKVKGAVAHFRGALDLDPFFVTIPYTDEAAKNQVVWETVMERELDRSDSQRQIFLAAEESCITGTGVMQIGVTQPYDEPLIYFKAVRLEDFFVAPTGVSDISRVSTFYRFVEPWHVVRRRAEDGEYDPDLTERARTGTVVGHNYDERKDGARVYTYSSESQPCELWECYVRWGDEELGAPYRLWRVIYHRQSSTILRVEPNPFYDEEAQTGFDAPPYPPLRPMPRVGYFYGESYMQVLEGIQNVMDYTYNALLAYMQYAITPTTFVDEDSGAYEELTRLGMAPGRIHGVRGNPTQQVEHYSPPPPTNAYQILEAARSLGDDATFNDLQLNGIPTNTVRSATEINALTSAATKKLAEDLSNLSHDLSTAARMYWAAIYHFKIKPAGVRPVFDGSSQYIIASQEISEQELTEQLLEFVQARSGIRFAPDEQAVLGDVMRQTMQQQGAELFISSAKRDDMEWVPNGAKLVPDKLVRAGKMERLIAAMLPALQLARQDNAAWHLFKSYLQSLDIHNWQDYLPPEPPEGMADDTQFAQFAQNMATTRQGGGPG